jgi:hypothetical protein
MQQVLCLTKQQRVLLVMRRDLLTAEMVGAAAALWCCGLQSAGHMSGRVLEPQRTLVFGHLQQHHAVVTVSAAAASSSTMLAMQPEWSWSLNAQQPFEHLLQRHAVVAVVDIVHASLLHLVGWSIFCGH